MLLGVADGLSIGAVSAARGALTNLGAKTAAKGGRVFWSGGGNPMVEVAAREFAAKNGLTTLEMTRAGKNLTKLTNGLPWEIASPMWKRLSKTYAKGTNGTAHVFQNSNGISIKSTWGTVEYPILKQNGVNIIYHKIP